MPDRFLGTLAWLPEMHVNVDQTRADDEVFGIHYLGFCIESCIR